MCSEPLLEVWPKEELESPPPTPGAKDWAGVERMPDGCGGGGKGEAAKEAVRSRADEVGDVRLLMKGTETTLSLSKRKPLTMLFTTQNIIFDLKPYIAYQLNTNKLSFQKK